MMRRRAVCASLTLAVLAIDQATKLLARTQFVDPIALGPFLSLHLSFNTGVTFGLLAGAGDIGRWVLVAGTAGVALWLLVWMWREHRLAVAVPLALVAGGALGNIVDRLRDGAVTDFIDAHVRGLHWPTFNLADAAIVIGVAWLILVTLRPNPDAGEAETRGDRAAERKHETVR